MQRNLEAVILKRQKSVKEVQHYITYINEILVALDHLYTVKSQLQSEDFLEKDQLSVIESIPFESCRKRLVTEKSIWEKLEKRFARNTINMGVVGRMGQGKSTFLQRITGLTDEVIPAKKGPACTSTQSNIFHNSNPEHEGALVHFYNEEEFLEFVVKPYFNKLVKYPQLRLPKNTPTIWKAFDELYIPQLSEETAIYSKEDAAYYQNFYELWKNRDQYKDNILKEREALSVTLDKVNQYVQYQYVSTTDTTKVSYEYVSIKRVDIYIKFGNDKAELLGLIDVPGLGDSHLGDEEKMIRAIGEDVDLILLTKKVIGQRDEWQKEDLALYDIIQNVLADKLPLYKWAILMVNKANAEETDASLVTNKAKHLGSIFAKYLSGDFSKAEDAKNILQQAIDFLYDEIINIDHQLMKTCKLQLYSLTEELHSIISNPINSQIGTGSNVLFNNKCEAFSLELRKSLIKLLEDLKFSEKQNKETTDFGISIKKLIEVCRNSIEIPDQNKYDDKVKILLSQRGVWDRLLRDVRAQILTIFHDLGKSQTSIINERKKRIARVLSQSNLLGKLNLGEGLEFLEHLSQLMKNNMPPNSTLSKGIQDLNEFHFSYSGYVQNFVYHIIKEYFDPHEIYYSDNGTENENSDIKILVHSINNICEYFNKYQSVKKKDINRINSFIEQAIYSAEKLKKSESRSKVFKNTIDKVLAECQNIRTTKDLSFVPKLENILADSYLPSVINTEDENPKSLEMLIDKALKRCEAELLYEMQDLPTSISISMVEEFIDRVAYNNIAAFDWQIFLEKFQHQIWEDVRKKEIVKAKIAEWNQALEMLKNSLNKFPK